MEIKQVSVEYEDKKAHFKLPQTFEDFMKLSIENLSLQQITLDSLSIYYKDEDDDTVVITSSYDYDQALKFFKSISDTTLAFTFESKSMNSSRVELPESIRSGMVFNIQQMNPNPNSNPHQIEKEKGRDEIQEEIERVSRILEKEQLKKEEERIEKELLYKKEKERLEAKKREMEEKEERIEKELLYKKEKERLEAMNKKKQMEEEEERKENERKQQELERMEIEGKRIFFLTNLVRKLTKRNHIIVKESLNTFKQNTFEDIPKHISVERKEGKEPLNNIKQSEQNVPKEENQQNKKKDDQMMSPIENEEEVRQRQERKDRIMQKIQEKAHEEVSRSRIMNEPNEYKSALYQIKDECSTDIAKKMSQYIDAQYAKMKEELIASTLKLNKDMIQTYIEKIGQVENERQSQFQNEMSKVSQSSLMSKTYTGIHPVFCNQCKKNPIVGNRYQCSECHDYNLCENCEESNYSTKIHPHDFIRIREQRKGSKPNKPLEPVKGKYSYECLNKERLFTYRKCTSVDNKFTFQLIIKNNYGSTWNETRLICDKLKSSIVCSDITVPKLAPEQSAVILVSFSNIDVFRDGNYLCVLKFNVDGVDYGEPLALTIKIEDISMNLQSLVKAFRQTYDLQSNDLSDYAILQALGKTSNNFQQAFSLIFP